MKTLTKLGESALEKLALARWHKELPHLSLHQRERLGVPGVLDREGLRSLRGALWHSGTDLSPSQLARHQGLQGRLGIQWRKNFFNEGPYASTEGGGIYALSAPAQGSARYQPKKDLAYLHHELGEFAQTRATKKGPTPETELDSLMADQKAFPNLPSESLLKPLPDTSHGTHRGGAPILAEHLTSFRDPVSRELLGRMRSNPAQVGPDEIALQKKLRQYGATHAAPIPLGGKQHARVEDWLLNLPQEMLSDRNKLRRQADAPSKIDRRDLMGHLSALRPDAERPLFDPYAGQAAAREAAEKAKPVRRPPRRDVPVSTLKGQEEVDLF